MVLKIRLHQIGRKNRKVYRLVVTPNENPRDGAYVEMVGSYDPFLEKGKDITVKADRIDHWLGQGAQLSPKAMNLVKRAAPDVIKAYQDRLRARQEKSSVKKEK